MWTLCAANIQRLTIVFECEIRPYPMILGLPTAEMSPESRE